MILCLNKTVTCDRQADRQMNRQTDRRQQSIPVLSNVVRVKMLTIMEWPWRSFKATEYVKFMVFLHYAMLSRFYQRNIDLWLTSRRIDGQTDTRQRYIKR